MKLAALGDRVSLRLVDERTVHAGDPSHALLYDGEGAYWPRWSLLVGPYVRGDRTAPKVDRAAREWFGPSYVLRLGAVDLPPQRLAGWRLLGDAARLDYRRIGIDGHKPPGPKTHAFNATAYLDLFAAKAPVRVYVRGVFLRVDLPRWAVVDGRGIARP